MKADRRRWSLSAGLILVLYGLGGWWLWRTPTLRPSPPPQAMQTLAIELAPRPRAPAAAPSARRPGRLQRASTASQAKPGQSRPPPPPRHTPRPRVVSRTPAPSPSPAQPAPASRPAEASAPPAIEATRGPDYAAPAQQAGASTRLRADWQSLLLARLQRYRRYPRQAERSQQQGVVWVRFAVDRQGRIGHSELQRPSGHRLLDQEALATLHRANPLPPPPADLPGDPVMVQLPVRFFLH